MAVAGRRPEPRRKNRVQPHRCFQLMPVVTGGAQRSGSLSSWSRRRRGCTSSRTSILPNRPAPTASYAVSRRRTTLFPSFWNRSMVVRCRPSHRASTSRCLLTCRMELGNHASTQCPQPRPVRHPAPKDIQVSTCGPQPFMRLITSTRCSTAECERRESAMKASGPTCGLLRRRPVRRANGDVPSRKSAHCF